MNDVPITKAYFLRAPSGLAQWLIRLVDCSVGWVNFELYEIGAWSKENTPEFRHGNEFKKWSHGAERVLSGHVKFDGCTEFTSGEDTHFCDGADSYADIHTVLQVTLSLSHSLLETPLWDPRKRNDEYTVQEVDGPYLAPAPPAKPDKLRAFIAEWRTENTARFSGSCGADDIRDEMLNELETLLNER